MTQYITTKRTLLVATGVFLVLASLIYYHVQSAGSYGGPFLTSPSYLNNNTATTSPTLVKSTAVETATQTMAFPGTLRNGWDAQLQYFATNTPGQLLVYLEYADETRDRSGNIVECSVTPNACSWYPYLGFTSLTTDPEFTLVATGTPYARIPVQARNSTTTVAVPGPRDTFHHFWRLSFKPDRDIPSMNLWAQVTSREPQR